jgi:hypothetical protein
MCSRICASKSHVHELLSKLKITPCPHCKTTGFLIRHGALIGYSLNQLRNTIRDARAVRVYCSNRRVAGNRHSNGCGRTFSVWTADKIKRLFLSADSLWLFLNEAVRSGNKLQALRRLQCGLSDSAAYHLWRRFRLAQVAIRTALSALCEPPPMVSDCPATLTLEHLANAFQGHPLLPIAAFAATLQTFFL